jgi:hypothetical protein
MQDRESRLLPLLVIIASAASVIATILLAFYGIYFFFVFVPIAFGLPWSIRKLWREQEDSGMWKTCGRDLA